MRSAIAHLPRRWWARLVPLPDRAWLAFRMETAYGDRRAAPSGTDLVAFLEWSRGERRSTREMHGRSGRTR